MHVARFLPALLFFLAALAGRAAERDIERVFPVQGAAALKIDTHRGAIIIVESDEPQIRVAVHCEIGADSEAEAERMMAGLQLDFKQEGNAVSILARNPPESVRWRWEERKQIDLTYRVSVPRRCDVDLKNRTGSFTVGNLEGHMKAWLESGPVFFRTITGSVEVKLDTGDLVVSRCSGDVTADVRTGLVRVGTVGGMAKLRNQSGDIELGSAQGPVDVKGEAGDILVNFPRTIGGPAKISSSGGNIAVNMDPAAACRIEASSSWGKISNLLPMTVEAGGNNTRKLTGRLNGGTTPIVIHASGGHVKLQSALPAFE